MTSGQPLLSVEHLTKEYGSVVALNDVTFSITDGITGILGENGAGKSTAIKILLGLLRPTSGTRARIKKIDMMLAGMVSTYFQLASHFRCMKNKITSDAFVQETAIMKNQPTSFGNGQYGE